MDVVNKFNVGVYADYKLNIFGKSIDIWITQTLVYTWIIMAFLVILALYLRFQLKKFEEIPTGKQNIIETIIESIDKFVKSILGKEYAWLGNWFFGIFTFILVSNLSGLVGFRPPTADISTTLALGLSTFLIMHFMGAKINKKKYLKSFIEPYPVFLPINIIGELATPLSLGFRLFGNLLGGLIIVGLFYNLLPRIVTIVLPSFLHAYFDVFAGCLQAYIFTMLSMTFIKNKIS